MNEKELQEINEEIAYAESRPLEFPLVHIAKKLVTALEAAHRANDCIVASNASNILSLEAAWAENKWLVSDNNAHASNTHQLSEAIDGLRKQLAEAQRKVNTTMKGWDRAVSERNKLHYKRDDLRSKQCVDNVDTKEERVHTPRRQAADKPPLRVGFYQYQRTPPITGIGSPDDPPEYWDVHLEEWVSVGKRGPCSTPETIANLFLIGCLVLAIAIGAIVAVGLVYFVYVY